MRGSVRALLRARCKPELAKRGTTRRARSKFGLSEERDVFEGEDGRVGKLDRGRSCRILRGLRYVHLQSRREQSESEAISGNVALGCAAGTTAAAVGAQRRMFVMLRGTIRLRIEVRHCAVCMVEMSAGFEDRLRSVGSGVLPGIGRCDRTRQALRAEKGDRESEGNDARSEMHGQDLSGQVAGCQRRLRLRLVVPISFPVRVRVLLISLHGLDTMTHPRATRAVRMD